ncbi:HD domain-containing protein [Clostridium sp.]|uniref:HD domain-containing protein n=1 Tax=Clostridium sp. TaxID=1506 RepID=UPI00399314DB
MIIKDYIYGEFEIDDVLAEIIETPEIQRLKKIYQGGSSVLVNKHWDVTRYEHSIGTMLLIKMLNGNVEEQIAGLIHDISHTAFSHVVDRALDYKNEDYHEYLFENIVKNSNIPNILKTNGFNIERILDESNWSILEKKAPKLCADRIDYTLRDLYHYKKITKKEIKDFLNSLIFKDNEIMINSLESSIWFVNTYYKEVIGYLMNPLNLYASHNLSEAIKIALNLKILNKSDLLKTDSEVLNILKNSNNQSILNLINELNTNLIVVEDKLNYSIYQKVKMRIVDPTVYIDNKAYLSSEKSNVVKEINNKMIKKLTTGIYIRKFVDN